MSKLTSLFGTFKDRAFVDRAHAWSGETSKARKISEVSKHRPTHEGGGVRVIPGSNRLVFEGFARYSWSKRLIMEGINESDEA